MIRSEITVRIIYRFIKILFPFMTDYRIFQIYCFLRDKILNINSRTVKIAIEKYRKNK